MNDVLICVAPPIAKSVITTITDTIACGCLSTYSEARDILLSIISEPETVITVFSEFESTKYLKDV